MVDRSISWHHADTSVAPLSWLKGSEVVVVDPPRKGLDGSLIDALLSLRDLERKAKPTHDSSDTKGKDEKRPWILRAREASVQTGGRTAVDRPESLPDTLIYISCSWESFKEDCKSLISNKGWHLEKAHGFGVGNSGRGDLRTHSGGN